MTTSKHQSRRGFTYALSKATRVFQNNSIEYTILWDKHYVRVSGYYYYPIAKKVQTC